MATTTFCPISHYKMQTPQAEQRLKTMLVKAEFDFQTPNPQLAWAVFKSFVQEPVDCAEDDLLFQCGTSLSVPQFSLDFVRQFGFEDEDGQYSHMEQLHCNFICPSNDLLNTLEVTLWSEDFESPNDYFIAVENLEEFQIAMTHREWQCKVEQEGV